MFATVTGLPFKISSGITGHNAGRTYKFEESGLMKQDSGKAMQLAAKYPEGVSFNEKGIPDFSPYVAELEDGRIIEVPITLTGNRKEDFKLCNLAFGWKNTPKGFTWHHHEDARTIQLLPKDLHNAALLQELQVTEMTKCR